MPTDSSYPLVEIPNLDLWAFLFERKDKPYPDNKGKHFSLMSSPDPHHSVSAIFQQKLTPSSDLC
jgi:hypothetical protein